MKVGVRVKVLMSALLLAASCLATAAYASEWTDYQTLSDGHQNGIDFRYVRETFDYSDGQRKFTWQFRNRYQGKVHLEVEFFVEEQGGQEATRHESATIAAGAESDTAGSWTIARRIKGLRIKKLTFPQ